MLGKDLAIANYKRQRDFIEQQLVFHMTSANKDGDPSYRYVGYIIPEVIEYFKNVGFKVEILDSEQIRAQAGGRKIYFFYPEVDLTADDLCKAEAFDSDEIDNSVVINEMFKRALEDSKKGTQNSFE